MKAIVHAAAEDLNVRKLPTAIASIVFIAVGLTGCSPIGSEPTVAWGTPSAGSSAPTPAVSGPLDLCSIYPAAALSAASGKSFVSDHADDDAAQREYGCAYSSNRTYGDWAIDVFEPFGTRRAQVAPYLNLGGSDQVASLNCTEYPAISARTGVVLRFGDAMVLVTSLTGMRSAEVDTAHYVAVADGVIAALNAR